jgi:hypothetical protein
MPFIVVLFIGITFDSRAVRCQFSSLPRGFLDKNTKLTNVLVSTFGFTSSDLNLINVVHHEAPLNFYSDFHDNILTSLPHGIFDALSELQILFVRLIS